MMITGVMVFAERLAYERLREVVESRFRKYRRFTQRAVQKTGGAFWETDPYFDLNRHVLRTALPGRADKAELQHLASDLDVYKRQGHERLHSWRLADYVADLEKTVQAMPRPLVLIGHSMGGMVIQKYLENHAGIAGVVLMLSLIHI